MGQAHTRPDTDGCTVRMGPLNYKELPAQKGFSQGSAPESVRSPGQRKGLVILSESCPDVHIWMTRLQMPAALHQPFPS